MIGEAVLTLTVAIVDGLSSTLGIDTSQHFTYIQLLKLFPLSYLARAFKNAPNLAENILKTYFSLLRNNGENARAPCYQPINKSFEPIVNQLKG